MKCRYETPCSKRCLGTKELDPCRGYDKCKDFQPNYTTNADRIRAMSDEELAKFLEGASIAGCPEPARSCRANCIDCILDWLREPVKDGDNK